MSDCITSIKFTYLFIYLTGSGYSSSHTICYVGTGSSTVGTTTWGGSSTGGLKICYTGCAKWWWWGWTFAGE